MHLRIRPNGLKAEDLVLSISVAAQISELQDLIRDKLKIENNNQRLYYAGKQLSSDHIIADYKIKLNDVIQLYVKQEVANAKEVDNSISTSGSDGTDQVESTDDVKVSTTCEYYKKGDRIDVLDPYNAAWFEAKILDILKPKNCDVISVDNLIFKIQMDRNVDTSPIEVNFSHIRPRAYHTYKLSELQPNMIVLVNYNETKPKERGYWYDFEIRKVSSKVLSGTLLLSREDCSIVFRDEVMRIEKPALLSERTDNQIEDIPLRKLQLYCNKCKDNTKVKCKACGCQVCALKDEAGVLLLCDECDEAYHLNCLEPPLTEVPQGNWYCPACKTDDSEIVKPGEGLKSSKKKLKVPSSDNKVRNWGSGMACLGRSQECTIVDKGHYGPIPGVAVGMCWRFRLQVSEVGVHRPHVAGIHGRESDGAYSIVLSGGYEDDHDNGEEFYYTGSGGRDLSGNKRTNEQSSDQKLTRMNKALALNCNAKLNEKTGATASDWRKGKPVRVVRSCKARKHSKYAPIRGNRYDGIYKVVKYFPQKGKSGFIVWRYLLRRDDQEAAPWEEGGQEFEMIDPPGYSEVEESKLKPSKVKRKLNSDEKIEKSPSVKTKKFKVQSYKLDRKLKELVKKDVGNEQLWKECQESASEGKEQFIEKVKELFVCACCLDVVWKPVALDCNHNICKKCLQRYFSNGATRCPCCRLELGKDFDLPLNEHLSGALELLLPGYGAQR